MKEASDNISSAANQSAAYLDEKLDSNPTVKKAKDSTVSFMKQIDRTVGSFFAGFVDPPQPLIYREEEDVPCVFKDP